MNIPLNWNKISLNQLNQLFDIPDSSLEITNFINRLAILTNAKREDIRKLSQEDAIKISEKLNFLNELPKSEKFSWIFHKFRVMKIKSLQELSNRDFIDLNEIIEGKDLEGDKVAKMMLILFEVKIGRKFSDYKELLSMPVGKSYSTMLFFYTIAKNFYLRRLELSLETMEKMSLEEMEKLEQKTKVDVQLQMRKAKDSLNRMTNGDGTLSF